MSKPTRAPAQPVTLYQFYLVHRCGHRLYREGSCYVLEANPERMEYTPGWVGHIPYADEDAADEWESQHPELGPKPERAAAGGYPVYPCNSCGAHALYGEACAC